MKKLQEKVQKFRSDKNYTTDLNNVYMLLVEEVGEIAKELKNIWSANYTTFSKQRLAEEIADVQICLITLANIYNIDIKNEVENKIKKPATNKKIAAIGADVAKSKQ